jgi:hypothetical protein
MGEVAPINVEGLSAADAAKEAVRGVMQLHDCLEKHRAEMRLGLLDANEKRQELAEKMSDIRDDVADLKGDVRDLVLSLGVKAPEKGERRPRGRSIATWGGWKLIAAASGCFTLFVVAFQLVVRVAPVVFDYFMGLQP